MVKELDSGKLMFSGGNNDECYTPDYGVKPILKYIPDGDIVWCPFDTKESAVSYTHLTLPTILRV